MTNVKLGKNFQKLLQVNESFNEEFLILMNDLHYRIPFIGNDENYHTPFLYKKKLEYLFKKYEIDAEAIIITDINNNINLSIRLIPPPNIVKIIKKPNPIFAKILLFFEKIFKKSFTIFKQKNKEK